MSYLVYILKSDQYSYVGMTNDFLKRFRQHNQEIKGGAKYTSRRQGWYPVCIIDGFLSIIFGVGLKGGRLHTCHDYSNMRKETSKVGALVILGASRG